METDEIDFLFHRCIVNDIWKCRDALIDVDEFRSLQLTMRLF